MYKLMIVEDEPLIRTGLKHYFAWQELGFETILEAENGKEGFRMALGEKPDMVITDIRMPEMDGLQMIEELRPMLPDTVFIILTGYNDFAYAQRAIRLGGVHAFLLKPLEYDESLSTLMQCLDTLKQQKLAQSRHNLLEREAGETMKLKRSQLVKLLLEESDPGEAELSSCGLEGTAHTYVPIVITWFTDQPHSYQTRRRLRNRAEQLAEELARSYAGSDHVRLLTYFDHAKMYALAILDDPALPRGDAGRDRDFAPRHALVRQAGREQAAFCAAAGPASSGLSGAGATLRQAERALYGRFFQPERQLFEAGSPGSLPAETAADPLIRLGDPDKADIERCLETGDAGEIKPLLARLAEEKLAGTPGAAYGSLLGFLQDLVSVTLRFAHKHGIPVEGVYSDKLLTLSCVDDFRTLAALLDWLGGWMLHLSGVYKESSQPSGPGDGLIFKGIEAYLRQHLDQDVTLQMVADRFFYNPSYLSRLFKLKLNKNYMTFVSEIRISHAMDCLHKPEYLVTDVCQMCGYKSYKHFVKTFKKITGLTPTDYRKKIGL
ncbi:response regulator [Paenibacillus sp. UNC499MF]|uniref:response regulator transcription factor n=1 Tax=Paenibacillus sp. UNC499MF TaxID=1502751 RepID=UPI0008A020B4|nr:response regulator [Paenibacillus sp. UNC499MF]SEF45173.1 two-component system, response regulator YesN [Paenibacillus sp. UNC499MF]